MPELPEVETVRRTLLPAIGATITGVATSGKPLRLGARVPVAALRKLVGARLVAMRRVGKYLLVDTDRDAAILVHLGMSGRFRVTAASDLPAPHTHVELALDGARALRFSDPRRFGSVDVVTPAGEATHPALRVLGPDPITTLVGGAHLHARSRGKRTPLKAFILDQAVLAGVGNIYASEALWRAGLRPTRQAATLTAERADALALAIRAVLEHALDHGGTTLRDFVDADGSAGEHADYLEVYGRDGQPCHRCGRAIRRTVLGGRATFDCTRCQR